MRRKKTYSIRADAAPIGTFGAASEPRHVDASSVETAAPKAPSLLPGNHVLDAFGDLWVVRSSRETELDFEIYLGVPSEFSGPAGPAVILTSELVDQFDRHRRNPEKLQDVLPIGKSTVTRIRRILGHHRYQDAELWWLERSDDLARLTLADFCARHRVSSGAASQARAALFGPQQRPNNWWKSKEALDILQSKMPSAWIAEKLGIAATTVRKYRRASE